MFARFFVATLRADGEMPLVVAAFDGSLERTSFFLSFLMFSCKVTRRSIANMSLRDSVVPVLP